MKLLQYLIPMTVTMVAAGCANESKHEKSEPKEVAITMADSIIIADNASQIRRMSVADNAVLMVTNDRDGFIKLLSYPDFTCVDSAGTTGHGPGEWIVVMTGKSVNSGEIPVYDIMNRSLRVAKIADSSIVISDPIELPTDEKEGLCMPYGNLIKGAGKYWYAKENDLRRSKLSAIDFQTGEVNGTFTPDLEISERIKGYPNDDYSLDADSKRVVVGYAKANKIVVLDADSLNVVAVVGEENGFEADKEYTINVTAQAGKFYLLQSLDNSSEGVIVRVVDGGGNELDWLRLDRAVQDIAFDDDGRLIGISETPDANICFRYELP